MKILGSLLIVLISVSVQVRADETVATNFSKNLRNCINGGTVKPANFDLWNKPGFKFTLKVICTSDLAEPLFLSLKKLKGQHGVTDIGGDNTTYFLVLLKEHQTTIEI